MRILQVGRAALVLALASVPAEAGVLLVCNGTAGCPGGFTADGTTRFATIAAAASAANSEDTILIWPGTYKEEVFLTKGDLTIRGMDRYGVVLDGDVDGDGNFNPDGTFDSDDNLGVALQAGNSSGSVQSPNVAMENMSARGFARQPFFWVNVEGFFGRHLTASDNGVYGIYAFKSKGDARNLSEFRNSYASGHSDGGFYIGECDPCNAVISHSWAENNALGYSGTNAGGNLTLEHSVWNDNAIGILPNTLPSENDLPQRGIHIRYNEIHDNNNGNTPVTDTIVIGPVGTGVLIAGGWQNQVYGNRIHGNDRYGVGLVTFFVPPQHNMTFSNTLWSNGTDLVDGGPGSFANCFSDNVNRPNGAGPDDEPSSDPPAIQTLNSCRSQVDPVAVQVAQNPVVTAQVAANGVVQLLTHETMAPQPAPATPLSPRTDTDLERAAVSCMNPCADLPDNDFCQGGNPVAGARSAECAASI